ncbi:hypothetical protein DXG01_010265, partial [Tephrocybe rancida]
SPATSTIPMTEAGASTAPLQVSTSVPAGAPGAASTNVGATAGATPPRQVAANAEAASIGDKGKARQPNSPPAGKSIRKGSPTVETLPDREGEPIGLGLPTSRKGPILMSVNDPSSSSVPKELPPHQATFNVISAESILSAASSRAGSEAPSLSFLLDRDTPGPEGPQDSKSDATEKPPHVLYNSHPRLFEGCPEVRPNDVRDEPIACSVYRYHVPWDPATEYDPIVHYGAVDGIIPGRSKEESDLVRDILIRWSSPHKDCLWTDMNTALKDFSKISISLRDLKPYDGGEKTVYALNKPRLNEIAQVSLAVHQVLDAFAAFMYSSSKYRFQYDPGYQLLRMLAVHSSRTEILLAWTALQRRTAVAALHIKNYFKSFDRIFRHPEDLESMSSHDSTVSSIRSAFGHYSPQTELRGLLNRPDYRVDEDHVLYVAQQELLQGAHEDAPGVFYNHRSRADLTQGDAKLPELSIRTENVPDSRVHGIPHATFDIPESISSIRQSHVLTTLPGIGAIPTVPMFPIPEVEEPKDGGPLLMQPAITVRGLQGKRANVNPDVIPPWMSHRHSW